MRSTSSTRAAATVLLLALGVMPLVVAPAAAKPSDTARRRAFNLFSVPIDILQVNNLFCPVSNRGKVCVNQNDNPLLEGGFWPRGTPDSYIYNSGLQIGGIIPNSPFTAGTADTVGVYFMDPRGSQFEGEGVTNVFNSANTADQSAWPNGAIARDPSLYNAVLLGKKVVSQQDLWVRVWDGNPANSIGGAHPLGIVVDERGMAWNYPTGNEDIVYFIYTVYNVSASNPAKYNNPTIDPALQSEIAAIGTQFKSMNDQHYGISIPADGYSITNTFLAFFEDCDVGVNSASNYATANFVFNLSFCYKSDFFEPTWTFPTDIFSAPLFVGPGFTGVKYLKSPLGNSGQELGLTLFSNTGNPTSSGGSGYIDARGAKQLYRYLSGTSSPAAGDNPCTNQGQQLALRYCFLFQVPVDARFFMSSGPFTLPAGESRTIVVAYVQAAALGTQFTAGCAVGGDCHSSPPPSPRNLANGSDTIRTIDKLAGWVSATNNAPLDTVISQNEVTTFPRTLFNKSLVAQTVFDNKFLLPFSPEQPEFFLLPGDAKVTVVWRPSVTEAVHAGGGDPYFEVASNPASPLYDPNFRQYDVEGYRIYRGRSSSDMQLIAQFDYAGTVLRDFTGAAAYPGDLDEDGRLGRCAPELAIFDDCPVGFPATGAPIDPTVYIDHVIAGDVVQIPLGGRVELKDGSVLITKADTAVVGGGHADRALVDGGVPFAFVDNTVLNSFTYVYAVTAFDVNSFRSGPSSLESPKTTIKTATPRAEAGQTTAGAITPPALLSARGDTLHPTAALPTIAAATGIFSGPMPPTDNFQTSIAVFADQLITGGTVTIRLDSVVPGHGDEGDGVGPIVPAQYYVSGFTGATLAGTTVIPLVMDGASGDNSTIGYVPVAKVDSSRAQPFQGSNAFSLYSSVALGTAGTWRLQTWGRGDANADPTRSYRNGPRWWTGTANENTPDPNKEQCGPGRTAASEAGPAGTCVLTDSSIALNKNAGSMPGVLIFHPSPYLTERSTPGREIDAVASTVTRAADFKVYWGAAPGVIDSVIDVTHGIPAPFKTKLRAGWGILNDSSFTNTTAAATPDKNNALLTLSDVSCIDPIPTFVGQCVGTTPAFLMNHAKLTPIAMHSGSYAQTAAFTTTGNGFIFYLNGHFFLMQMAALPTAGTVWNARFYSGRVRMSAADSTQYSFAGSLRPPTVPGLRAQFQFTGATFDSTTTSDTVLAKVHTVPDPYYVTNALEISPNTKVLKFVHLPARCIIRIYSTSAILVNTLTHNDPTGGAEETWNLRNRNNQFVASGVYFFHVEAPDGKTKVGRFTIVNFAR
jgi:hypothetical protein